MRVSRPQNIFDLSDNRKRKQLDFNIADARKSVFAKIINEEDIITRGSQQRLQSLMADKKMGLFDVICYMENPELLCQERGILGDNYGPVISDEYLETMRDDLTAHLNIDEGDEESWTKYKKEVIIQYEADKSNPLSPYSHLPQTTFYDENDNIIDDNAIAAAAENVPETMKTHAKRMLDVLLNNPGWNNAQKLKYFKQLAEMNV